MPDFESAEVPMSPEDERRWRQHWAHGELVARRLHRLVERGYRPVFRGDDTIFALEHSNPKATPIQLWPDGQVVDLYPTHVKDGERTIIHPEDGTLFVRFLDSVPPPSPIAKALSTRIGDALSASLGYAIVLGVLWGFVAVATALWASVFGE
ncbi:hypothetical protein [Phenylobacterium sp.]|uniref:hypothetical protein n=1 Tax=Phenylobacterium sp. TaxID=1871053 RepID=UPI0035B3C353